MFVKLNVRTKYPFSNYLNERSVNESRWIKVHIYVIYKSRRLLHNDLQSKFFSYNLYLRNSSNSNKSNLNDTNASKNESQEYYN